MFAVRRKRPTLSGIETTAIIMESIIHTSAESSCSLTEHSFNAHSIEGHGCNCQGIGSGKGLGAFRCASHRRSKSFSAYSSFYCAGTSMRDASTWLEKTFQSSPFACLAFMPSRHEVTPCAVRLQAKVALKFGSEGPEDLQKKAQIAALSLHLRRVELMP